MSHTKPQRTRRRYDKAHGFTDETFVSFLLRVTKRQNASRVSVIHYLARRRGDREEIPESGETPDPQISAVKIATYVMRRGAADSPRAKIGHVQFLRDQGLIEKVPKAPPVPRYSQPHRTPLECLNWNEIGCAHAISRRKEYPKAA